MLDAGQLREAGSGFRDEQLARAFERYDRLLAAANALDFDDLLLKAVALFDASDAARERYVEQFRYIMVDEYQDTNRPQYRLLQQLASHRNLCVVGDPRSVDLQVARAPTSATSSTSSGTSPKPPWCASSATTAPRR